MKLSRLSRLPRAHSINLKHAAPGNANPFLLEKANPLDRNHPALKLTICRLPSYSCPQFTIRAFPNGVLQEPNNYVPISPLLATGVLRAKGNRSGKAWWSKVNVDPEKINPEVANSPTKPWNQDVAGFKRKKWLTTASIAGVRMAALAESGSRSLGLAFRTAKKTTSKSSVVRRRLRSKVTAAIRLVACRDADAVDAPESGVPRPEGSHPPLKLITNPLPQDEQLILQGWTYIVVPQLSLYRMPMPNIVQHVRKAFQRMKQSAHHLEETWASKKTLRPPLHRPPLHPASWHPPARPAQPPVIPSSLPRIPRTTKSDTITVQTLTSLPDFRPHYPRRVAQNPQTPQHRQSIGETSTETPVRRARPSALPRMFARPPVILPSPKRRSDSEDP